MVYALLAGLVGALCYYILLQKRLLQKKLPGHFSSTLPLEPIVLPCHTFDRKTSAQGKRIALFGIANSTEAEQFVETFQDQETCSYHISSYDTAAHTKSLTALFEELLASEPTLIYTIGHHATAVAREVSVKTGKLIPIVFSSIYDDWWAGLQNRAPVYHMIGITITPQYPIHETFIPALRPRMERLVILADVEYDPVERIAHQYRQRGVTVSLIRTNDPREILAHLSDLMPNIDTVLALENSCARVITSHIAALCREYSVAYISSTLSDASLGAAVSCGLADVALGKIAAEKALAILDRGMRPDLIGLSHVSVHHSYELRCNHAAMKAQGITADDFSTAAKAYGYRLFITPHTEDLFS